jgi:hypothetical protein
LQARATPIGGAQTSQTLAERRQRCDKTDAAPKNDPKRKKISKPRSETMIFRGICGIASLHDGLIRSDLQNPGRQHDTEEIVHAYRCS